MPDKKRDLPASLFDTANSNPDDAPLVVSSDILVMMLHIVGVLRRLMLVPAIGGSSASPEIRATIVDTERRLAALLRTVDELTEMQVQKRARH